MERLVPLVMDAAGSSNGQLADGIFSLTSADAGRGAGTASHSRSTSSSGSGVFGRRNPSLDSTGAALTASDPISAKSLLAKIGRRGGASGCASARLKVGKIGRAHVLTPVTNAPLVCRLLLAHKNHFILAHTLT